MASPVTRTMDIEVVWVDACMQVQERRIALPQDSSLEAALLACQLVLQAHQTCGVWGRCKSLQHGLKDGDRVEVYQPLKVDPKVARRERFAQQGARSAGLFARKRAHSKAGY